MKRFVAVTTLTLFILSASAFVTEKPLKAIEKILKQNYSLIPTGEIIINDETTSVSEFYISKTEVANINYREYLLSLGTDGKSAEAEAAKPDQIVWKKTEVVLDEYSGDYFNYPGFRLYPLVGVSYEQANDYCKWLENIYNERLNGSAVVEVRLPTEAEWMKAARGDMPRAIYPWGGPYTRNGKGAYLANFKVREGFPQSNVTTSEVYGFTPYGNGLYNMSGNVAEMITEKGISKGGSWNSTEEFIEISSRENYDNPSATIGFRPVIVVKK